MLVVHSSEAHEWINGPNPNIFLLIVFSSSFITLMGYLALNPYLERVHGISAESIIGTTLQQAAGEAYSQIEPAFKAVISTGQPVLGLEVQGVARWVDNLFPVKDERGKVKLVCAVVTPAPPDQKLAARGNASA